jgi:hypothetical protein
MRRKRLAVALGGIALVAVIAHPSSPESAAPPAQAAQAAPAALTPSASATAEPSEKQLAAFVTAFRQKCPKFAEGRGDQPISHDAANSCAYIRAGESADILAKAVADRFQWNHVRPTKREMRGIIKVLRDTACPA